MSTRVYFSGTYDQRMDAKSRFILPAPLRKLAERDDPSKDFYITIGEAGCLNLYTSEGWAREIESMMARRDDAANAEDYSTLQTAFQLFSARAHAVTLGEQGRLSIPGSLKESSGLGGDLTIIGAIERIEIWDPKTYERRAAQADAEYAVAIDKLTGRRR